MSHVLAEGAILPIFAGSHLIKQFQEMNGLYLFIDNANIFIEARRVAKNEFLFEDVSILRLRLSFVNLLDVIQKGRTLSEAVLVGSRPPEVDALWKKLEQMNINNYIFDRSFHTGKEKQVDARLSPQSAKP